MIPFADLLLGYLAWLLPPAGLAAVMAYRFCESGPYHRWAQQCFFACLAVAAVVTLLTLARGVETWMVTSATLPLMTIGATLDCTVTTAS